MSKLENGKDNPGSYLTMIKVDGKGKVTVPRKEYTIGVTVLDVKNDVMKLANVDEYSYKEIDGEVYRVDNESGKIYKKPVTKAQFEAIKRIHEEHFEKEKDDEGMEH